MRHTDYSTVGGDSQLPTGEYFSSKFTEFYLDPKLRLIFGQKRSTLKIDEIIDQGKILLLNLSKGELAESNSRFLGMVLMAKILSSIMKRIRTPRDERRPCYLYVDEFQNLATSNFSVMLSESRKFGLGLVLANQFLSQINDLNIMQAIFGNVGTLVSFRLGNEDAAKLESEFFPVFDRYHLSNIPNWEACVKTTVEGQVVKPFSLNTILPPIEYSAKTADEVVKRSRFRYGVAREKVEAEIAEGLKYEPKPTVPKF